MDVEALTSEILVGYFIKFYKLLAIDAVYDGHFPYYRTLAAVYPISTNYASLIGFS